NSRYPVHAVCVFMAKRCAIPNIALVNDLADSMRDRLVPHARAYTKGRLRRIYRRARPRPLIHSYVFPGFDHIMANRKIVGRALRWLLYPLENSPLRIFGLSHFVVLGKE